MPRKCTCDKPKFSVDIQNREIVCECGMSHDPFEALVSLASRHEELNKQQVSLFEQRKQWLKEKPHSVIFKRLEQSYRRGKMLPYCPKCNQLFDFKEVTSFGNAEFYRKLEEHRRLSKLDD